MEHFRYAPMQAQRTNTLPLDESWVYEPHLIGLRIVAQKTPDRSRLFTSGGHAYTDFFPEIVRQLPEAVQASEAVIDGEIVALDNKGRVDPTRRFRALGSTVVYFAFDILELDEQLLINEPWKVRRQFLEHLFKQQPNINLISNFNYNDVLLMEREAKRKKIDGVIAKRRDSLYLPNRSSSTGWLRYGFPPPQRRKRQSAKTTASK